MMKHLQQQSTPVTQRGFAMLFTVLIVSIILSIAIGISNVTFKQNLLSSIARDSQVAFFAADAGVECGLGYDLQSNYFPRGYTPAQITTPTLTCDTMSFSYHPEESSTGYFVYRENVSDGLKPCRSIVFDKTDPVVNKVQSRGYSICNNTPRQVERALEVLYEL